MKKNTPTTKLLLFFSWSLAVLGAALAAYIVLSRGINAPTLIKAGFTVFGGLISATALRTFANIGQLVFDLKHNQCDGFSALSRHHQEVVKNHQEVVKNHQDVVKNQQGVVEEFWEEFQALKNVVEQLSCDLKDVNQNIHQMNRNIQEMSQNIHQVTKNTDQVNEFFLKMKCHIETQQ